MISNKRRFGFILASSLIFAVGYGTGRSGLLPLYNNAANSAGKSSNYTTSKGGATNANSAAAKAKPAGDPTCPMKGNVASSKEKKYYTASDRGYAQVKPEQCFDTEAEAQVAGYAAAANSK